MADKLVGGIELPVCVGGGAGLVGSGGGRVSSQEAFNMHSSGDIANINGSISISHVSVVGKYLLRILVELVSVMTLMGLG
jgi:hypothetical protein